MLLCSYGATHGDAMHLAVTHGHDDLAEWLRLSEDWSSPLHYLTVLSPARAIALLREGADLHACGSPEAMAVQEKEGGSPRAATPRLPTPLDLAHSVLATGPQGGRAAAFDWRVSLSTRKAAALAAAHAAAAPEDDGRDVVAEAEAAVVTAVQEEEENARRIAELLVEAAQPWSPTTHELFPASARARAVELIHIGELLCRSEGMHTMLCGGERALMDVWRDCVVPHAVERSSE